MTGLAFQAIAACWWIAFMKPALCSFSFWPRVASAVRRFGVTSFSIAWMRSGIVASESPVMREIGRRVAGIERDVRLDLRVGRAEHDDLGARADARLIGTADEIVDLVQPCRRDRTVEREHDVGRTDRGVAALGVIERMPVGHVHARAVIDHGRLQRLGELSEQLGSGFRALNAAGDDHRVLGGDEHLRGFGERDRVADRLRTLAQPAGS